MGSKISAEEVSLMSGAEIKYRLKTEAGYSLKSLAELIDRDPTTVSKVINGQRTSLFIMEKIAEVLEAADSGDKLSEREMSAAEIKYRLKNQAGYSLTSFADAIGRCPSTVSQVIYGHRTSQPIMERIADVLGAPRARGKNR